MSHLEIEIHLKELTQQLLDSIANRDWETYTNLCDENLSCFEPEAKGFLVEGMPFHKFYFENPISEDQLANTTISGFKCKIIGKHQDAAIVTYNRLIQVFNKQSHKTICTKETRIWEKQEARWQNVHFHRSEG